jgi:hypothetical protein
VRPLLASIRPSRKIDQPALGHGTIGRHLPVLQRRSITDRVMSLARSPLVGQLPTRCHIHRRIAVWRMAQSAAVDRPKHSTGQARELHLSSSGNHQGATAAERALPMDYILLRAAHQRRSLRCKARSDGPVAPTPQLAANEVHQVFQYQPRVEQHDL